MEPTGGPAVEPAEEVRDFTIRRPPIRFALHGEEYAAPPTIGGMALKKVGALYADFSAIDTRALDGDTVERMVSLLGRLFEALIAGEDGRRLAAALASEDDPIDLQHEAIPIFYYLLERFGLRPTAPSSSSVNSVAAGGSTDGAPVEESTPTDSTPSDS